MLEHRLAVHPPPACANFAVRRAVRGGEGFHPFEEMRPERRGKELAAEQVAHVSSELKVYERTRLAVELHDSLSQTLTGVSMGIDSAIDLAQGLSDDLKRQLEYTSKTVEACRTELKNCLWDLRSEALEATDDLVMPKMDGVETTAALREKSPGTKVLILTSFGTSEDLSRALNAGATGAILKNAANCERTFPTESCIQSPPNGRLQARASRCAGARLASRSEDRRESRCGRNRLVPVP